MYVRWLGAFHKNGSLSESISFEMTRETCVACERFKETSRVPQSRVGLLIPPSAVYKRFDGDVWSVYNSAGELYYTRRPYRAKTRNECWAFPVYTGIVIKNGSLNTLKHSARAEIIKAHEHFNLPVYRLVKGKLIEEKI